MKKYHVVIEGKTPYMQHRHDDESLDAWEKRRGAIIERKDVSKTDLTRALFHMHSDNDKPYLPCEHIEQSMIEAGKMVKSKVGNAKKSMSNIVAAMFSVYPQKIQLPNNWVVDKRSAVNRNVKARIIVVRPKWETWQAEFDIEVDNDSITSETVEDILKMSGQYVGIGSYRPQNKGKFGRFNVVKFSETKLTKAK
jgi:hypothetical protein